jgi:WD40 repeat protein
VNEIRWTVNSDYLLSATAGGDMGCIDLIHFQDESNLTVIDSISAHTSICYQLQIDSTNRRMAVGGMDNLISLWDLNDLVCHQAIYMEYLFFFLFFLSSIPYRSFKSNHF